MAEAEVDYDDVILETREDLNKFLINSKYDFTILKFQADWCKPCKSIGPFVHDLVEEKIQHFNKMNVKNKFIFVEVDVDECFDLYAYLKKKKMINGIPAIFLYSRELYSKADPKELYIPHGSISGTNQDEIRKVLDYIK